MRVTNPIPGPDDIARRQLDNGIVVLARENFTAQSVVVAGSLPAGMIFEAEAQAGLAAFTASNLLYGTASRDFDALHETLEGIGADLGISAGSHSTIFGGKSLAEDLPTLLDVLQDALRHPAFPPDHVERYRGQLITGLQMRTHDTGYRAGIAFRELAYPPGHPYRRSSEGTLETVPALTRELLIDYHRRHYGPRGLIVSVVGAVDAQAALDAVEQALGDWRNPAQPEVPALPPLAPLNGNRQRVEIVPGKTQSDLVLGVPGPDRLAPDYHAARLANSVLGVFGMMGRLGQNVREAQGLAYYVYSMVEGQSGPGPWRVIAGVNPANVQQALDSIAAEVARLTREPVSEDDLDDNKAFYTGQLPLQLERNEGVAYALLRMERFGLGLDYLRTYADRINALTVNDLLRAAQHYWLVDGEPVYVQAVAGPDGA